MEIDVRLVALLAFAAVVLVIVAVWMIGRDVVRARRASAPSRKRLRVARVIGGDRQTSGPLSATDRWFDRLVTESGLPIDALSAALLLVCVGLVPAVPAFLWTDNVLSAAVLMILGMGVAMVFLVWHRRRRLTQIQEQLPDVIDQIARNVRAGGSLDHALASVADKSDPPLRSELQRCARQLEMGVSLAAALRSLGRRIQLMDVQMVVTTLAVHRQTGGSLALTLERMAAVMRERLNYRRQIRATTAAGRLSATLVAAAGPILFLYFFLLKADYIQVMLNDPFGQGLLIAAVLLEVVGVVWIMGLMRAQA